MGPPGQDLLVAIGRCSAPSRALLLVAQAWFWRPSLPAPSSTARTSPQLEGPDRSCLLAVFVLRALVAWAAEVAANRCSARVKSMLRAALVERVAVLGPDGHVVGRSGDLATLAVRGIDALDGYFSRYLPQLVLAVIVPMTVLVAVLGVDWVSAVIMLVTLPLIPVFMALVGLEPQARTDRQFRALQLLSGHFLDVVRGLTTLKIFGRSRAQLGIIGDVTDSYRRTMMATLRVTFLSSLVLELLASVSVALVAVAIGLRLLDGHISLRSSLFVLVLAPEAYLPCASWGPSTTPARRASAAEQVFDVLDQPLPARGRRTDVPDPAEPAPWPSSRSGFTYPGRERPALDGVTFEVRTGRAARS